MVAGSCGTIPPNLAQKDLVIEENRHTDRNTDRHDGSVMCFYPRICKYAKMQKT